MVSFRFLSAWGAQKRLFLRLFPYYGGLCRKVLGDRLLFSSFAVAATLHGLGHGATALAAGLLTSALIAPTKVNSSSFKVLSDPATLAFVGLLATLVKGSGATLAATIQSRLAQNVVGSVRQTVSSRLLAWGTPMPAGQLSARLAVRLREIERGVGEGLLAGIRAVLTLVPLAAALYVASSTLAWAAFAVLAPFGIAMSWARRAWKQSHAHALGVAEGLHREVDELVAHIDVWRTYGAGERVATALETLNDQAARAASRAEASRAALSSANEILAAGALLVCVWFARRWALPLGDGTLVAFAALFFMSYRPLRDLGDARAALDRGEEAFASLEELVPRELGTFRRPVAAPRRWTREVLSVTRLGVPRGDALLRTSFTAEPGQIVAIIGPTGSGKTSLLRSLLGLEPAATGSVRYGCAELMKCGVGPLERPFAWMPQDSPILAGTLEENLLADREAAQKVLSWLAEIGAAALLEGCRDVELGAAGRAVSGGERKWIALARAIATDLPVLLLDEPTAGLDRAAQTRVLEALDRMCGERTVILVSHQAEVVAIADRVIRVGDEDEDQEVHGDVHEAAYDVDQN